MTKYDETDEIFFLLSLRFGGDKETASDSTIYIHARTVLRIIYILYSSNKVPEISTDTNTHIHTHVHIHANKL